MTYEKFRREVKRVLEATAVPLTWNQIKARSTTLKQKAPYHVFVQKLQGDIGLVRLKPKTARGERRTRTVWALRRWFEDGRFRELLPEKVRLTILSSKKDHAIAANEHWELKRIFPLPAGSDGLKPWDVVEAEVEAFFPEVDRRPESIKIRGDGLGLRLLQRIEDGEERLRVAEKVAETGEFLHTDAWRGKTLGVTKPRFRCFYFYDSRCQFFCDQSVCVGHDLEVEAGGEGGGKGEGGEEGEGGEKGEGGEGAGERGEGDRESVEIKGDKVFFVLEAVERKGGEFVWEKERVEWRIKSVISLTDPRQQRLFLN